VSFNNQNYPTWEDPGMPSNQPYPTWENPGTSPYQPMPPQPEPKKAWFRRNSRGIASIPQTWQGWAIVIGVVMLAIIIRLVIANL